MRDRGNSCASAQTLSVTNSRNSWPIPTPATNPICYTLGMQKTHSAGGVVRNVKGEVALVLHSGWFWGFPKGHVDPGETILETAKREIREEIGITELEMKKEFEPYMRPPGDETDVPEPSEIKTIHMFLFDTPQEEFHLTEEKHTEARWVPVEEVANMLNLAKDKEFFLGIKDSLK